MKLFDEDGNYVGEFVMDKLEDIKDSAVDAFDDGSWILGLIFLLVLFPGWTILGGFIYLVCKLISLIFKLVLAVIKLALKAIWWLIRLPFTLIFSQEFPEF